MDEDVNIKLRIHISTSWHSQMISNLLKYSVINVGKEPHTLKCKCAFQLIKLDMHTYFLMGYENIKKPGKVSETSILKCIALTIMKQVDTS